MDVTDNLILAALPTKERSVLLAHSRVVPLEVGEVLYEQGEGVETLHFPIRGAVSLIVQSSDGGSIEPAIIGREGVLGFPIGLGDDISRWRSIVQLPGAAVAVSRAEVIGHLLQAGSLGGLLAHYSTLLITFVAQSALCYRLHGLDERVTRALLLMHDRAESDRFEVTHATIATMVGAHRPAVTGAIHRLGERGLIRGVRSELEVLDRVGLEAVSCECYARVRIRYDERVFSVPDGRADSYEPGEVNRD